MGAPDIAGVSAGGVPSKFSTAITGDLDDVSGNNGADIWTISSGSTYGSASVDANGVWTYTLDESNPAVQGLANGDVLIDTFTVRVDDIFGSDTQVVTITITGVPCFLAGTLIETSNGHCAIETVQQGDLVVTVDAGLQVVRWIGRFDVSYAELAEHLKLRPIRIAAQAFGPNQPGRDLLVSRQHRFLVSGVWVKHYTGQDEVLLPAHRLLELEGVSIDMPDTPISYYHMLFDQHHVIFAENVACETLWNADSLELPQTNKPMPPLEKQEPARLIPTPRVQAEIVEKLTAGNIGRADPLTREWLWV